MGNFVNSIGLIVPHPLQAETLIILTSGLHPALGLKPSGRMEIKPSGRMETLAQNFGFRPGGGAELLHFCIAAKIIVIQCRAEKTISVRWAETDRMFEFLTCRIFLKS